MVRLAALTLGVATYYMSAVVMAAPVTTAFTYQGQLKNAGVPVTGPTNLEFGVWTAASGGSLLKVVGPVTLNLVDGLFTAQIDFGDGVFTGDARWLEVRVEDRAGTWTTLSPRQPITVAPYALTAKKAAAIELPFAATVNTVDSAVAVTQTGSGRVISLSKSSGDEPVVHANQSGAGPCGQFVVNNVGSGEAAVLATSIGNGPGVYGKGAAAGAAVQGSALGTGRAASFHTEYITNDSPTVYAEQKGTGRCGHFRITNANNDLNAVAGSTTGDGAAVSAYTVGAGPAVHAKTDGTGYAIHADSTDDAEPEGGGVVLIGRETGNNVAIDGNEIMARSNGEASNLYVNVDGGDVVFGGAIDIGYEIVSVHEEESASATALCPAGKKVLGGGCSGGTSWDYIEVSEPWGSTGWHCRKRYESVSVHVYAICANVK